MSEKRTFTTRVARKAIDPAMSQPPTVTHTREGFTVTVHGEQDGYTATLVYHVAAKSVNLKKALATRPDGTSMVFTRLPLALRPAKRGKAPV